MANTKISALSSASTPLSGSEIVPLNQSGTTDSVSVANLTAGRAVSALSFTAPTIGAGSSSSLSLQSNGATNATLDTSGNLLLGSTSTIDSTFRLQVTGNGGSISHSVGTNANSFRFINTNTTSQWSFGTNSPGIQNAGDYFAWSRLPNGGSWSEFMRLDSSGNLTNQTGNYIQGTAGKGINFTANTPASGYTSQLLNWYEEGTWTPAQGSGLTVVGAFSSTGKYTRIGREVRISATVTGATSVAVSAAGIITNNLPFTVGTAGHGNATNAAVNAFAAVICTTTNVTSAGIIASTGTITFSATYFV